MLRPRPCSIALILCAYGCSARTESSVRVLEVRGLPTCPPRASYARPIVIRVDRERALFDEPYTTQTRIDTPACTASLSLPRTRMRVSVRAGLCTATSVGTWDCAAATWLASANLNLDGRATPAILTLPGFEAPCTPATR
jgi:hypothetical protein